jgi:transglutaminase-like putative cysteine protease
LSVTITRRQQGHLDEFPFCAESFASGVPVRESIFLLGGDVKDLKYRTSKQMEPQTLPEGLCWRWSDPIIAREEPLQQPAADFLPMLWISDASAKWPNLASNYLASISDRLQEDPDVKNLAQQLTANLTNVNEKIAMLTSYVQTNLTYKAIEFGRRARIPNKPADIMHNHYGDCKDHSLLLQQMLTAAGVPSQLALVNHLGPIQKDLPSLDQFDHMIVYVPGAGGGRFLDCTSKGADMAGAVPVGLAGQEALVLDPVDPRFVIIPHYPTNASRISVEQNFHLVDQTDITVEESLNLEGVHAAYMRGYLLQVPEADRRTMLQNAMGMGDADLTDFKIESLNNTGKPLLLRFSYSLKHQFHRSDNQLRGILRAGFARSYLTASPVDDRLTPFEITVPLSIKFREIINVPAGFDAMPPDSLDLQLDPRFATGQGSGRAEGGQLILDLKCKLLPGKFDATDYAAYRLTMSQALAFIEREVVLKGQGH